MAVSQAMKNSGRGFPAVWAIGLLILAGCDGSTTASAETSATADTTASPMLTQSTRSLSPQERAAVFAAMRLSSTDGDQVINACDEAITPDIHFVPMGGAIGTAVLVVLSGGEEAPGCYGMPGMEFTLLREEGTQWRILFSALGQLAVLSTSHNDVQDIVIGGPGFEFPVYHWSGTEFIEAGTIADTEFPIPIN
jgi:hypothetical protein